MEIEIIYQDENILVANKPAGLAVHKNSFMPHDAPYLTKFLGDQTGKWVNNVHRLDSMTSGVIVLAFNSKDAAKLSGQFASRKVSKTYEAIVRGIPGEGIFDQPVKVKNKSKLFAAETAFQTIKSTHLDVEYRSYKEFDLSHVKAMPKTGRWHQLRQHFAHSRFDIIGDQKHGDRMLNSKLAEMTGAEGLMLHASKIIFTHPETGEDVTFEAQLPERMKLMIDKLF